MTKDLDDHGQLPVHEAVPTTLDQPGAVRFWIAIVLTGTGAGIGAAALAWLLHVVQRIAWGSPDSLLQAATQASAIRHVLVLLAAGLVVGVGQWALVRLSSGNGIDITEAIWFSAGRLPKLRTLGSAVLSILIVGMGASLGREGAPKQTGAVIGNALSDVGRLSDEQRRLIVACGAGAGMAAAYGVPLGGALFSLEVLRGELALRYVLPALLASLVATVVSWVEVPDLPTYSLGHVASAHSILVWAIIAGVVAGLVSVAYVKAVAFVYRRRPQGWKRLVAPVLALGLIGLLSLKYPEVLGNGRDVVRLALRNQLPVGTLAVLLLLRPLATLLCLGSGAPGGLFTPTLSIGALLGGMLGYSWSLVLPGTPADMYVIVGAAAVLAATTQGPVSTIVLMWELTGHDRSFAAPMLAAVIVATLIARSISSRSIYDAKLNDDEIRKRQRERSPTRRRS